MSNLINENIKENIAEEVCNMAEKDIWNVIFAIQNEFGIANVPSPVNGKEGFIDALIELRFDEVCR